MIHRPAQFRQGFSLLWFLFLIPLILTFSVVVVQRLQTAMIEAQRNQDRVQARLLAASALVVFQDQLRSGSRPDLTRSPLVQGKIQRCGEYQILAAPDGHAIIAQGAVTGRQGRFICEIGATLDASSTLRVTAIRHRAESLPLR